MWYFQNNTLRNRSKSVAVELQSFIWFLHNLLLVLLISHRPVVGLCVSQGVTAKKGRGTGK